MRALDVQVAQKLGWKRIELEEYARQYDGGVYGSDYVGSRNGIRTVIPFYTEHENFDELIRFLVGKFFTTKVYDNGICAVTIEYGTEYTGPTFLAAFCRAIVAE